MLEKLSYFNQLPCASRPERERLGGNKPEGFRRACSAIPKHQPVTLGGTYGTKSPEKTMNTSSAVLLVEALDPSMWGGEHDGKLCHVSGCSYNTSDFI